MYSYIRAQKYPNIKMNMSQKWKYHTWKTLYIKLEMKPGVMMSHVYKCYEVMLQIWNIRKM